MLVVAALLAPPSAAAHKFQPADIQNIKCDDMSLADFTQQIFYRHFAILEIQLHRGRSLDTHLMFFRSLGKSFKPSFNNKCGKFIAVNLCKYGIYICKTTIGDPAFLPV